MSTLRTIAVLFTLTLAASAAEPRMVTFEEADARLKRAYALSRESNDVDLGNRVLDLRDHIKTAFDRKDLVAAERLIRDAEELVGLDAGGKTMFGLPVSNIAPERLKQLNELDDRLAAAMKKAEASAVIGVVEEINKVVGDQAGLPDMRRKGETTKPFPVKPADVAELFVKALEADPRTLKALSTGVPAPGSMPRGYASVVQGCLLIRPFVELHQKTKLETLDALISGCCRSMVALQVEKGHFKFPDLRGKHERFGVMIDKLVAKDPNALRDGWLVVPDPEGGSQFDAGECGMALLRAGQLYKNAAWTAAGRKAADWAMTQPTVSNWNYNAFSVSLLCEAHRLTGEKKYLDEAFVKFRVGIAPGQGPNGRWIDAHNARTVYHVILLRAIQDLEETLPAGMDRNGTSIVANKAVTALLDEADKLGAPMTSHTVQELARHLRLHPDGDKRARALLEQAASAVIQKCSQGGRVKAAVPLPELGAAGSVWAK